MPSPTWTRSRRSSIWRKPFGRRAFRRLFRGHHSPHRGVWPGTGRIREERGPLFSRVRSLAIDGVPSRLIVYDEMPGAVIVLRVIHGARQTVPALLA